ncbi:glycosyltransferase family 2 protein [Paenibacillus sp. MER TA 81-3]|uniref:glycosyltransferase family 2 protein n=1 Tax=Paenibacillus sp. MER TA 81-3 TaxID=2939573 RepID=UPI00203ACBDD|nr:glycosyltransferase family 2 protein [Paenibacillus sp. MER TA 81-3]MCM3338824.1 glycosyltransferase family 2 protein [Paenibacillus sp. MER TA 81-3]
MKNISIIVPVYQEGDYIYQNINEINSHLEKLTYDFNYILVDDGSSDNTWGELEKIATEYRNVTIIRFSRNFGKEAAIFAGLEYAEGEASIIMDSDLQHPPNLIGKMLSYWEQGYEVVEAVKSSRGDEKLWNKFFSNTFYVVLNKLAGYDLSGASDFKVLDRKVVESLNSMKERNTFFRGLSAWVGYSRKKVLFSVEPRKRGITKWSFKSLFILAKNAITAFSTVPLHFITTIGVFFLVGAMILGVQTLVQKISGNAVSGFTTVILLLLIIGSILMIAIGIIGEYIAKIYEEIKSRPRYIIKTVFTNKKSQLNQDVMNHEYETIL